MLQISTFGKNCFRSNSYMSAASIRLRISLQTVRVPLPGKYACWCSCHHGSSHMTNTVFSIDKYTRHSGLGTPSGLHSLGLPLFGMYTLLKSTLPSNLNMMSYTLDLNLNISCIGRSRYHLGKFLCRCATNHTFDFVIIFDASTKKKSLFLCFSSLSS